MAGDIIFDCIVQQGSFLPRGLRGWRIDPFHSLYVPVGAKSDRKLPCINYYKRKGKVQIQRIVIVYNCIGSIEIPEEVNIPLPQIQMATRQGVTVTYDPTPLASVNH